MTSRRNLWIAIAIVAGVQTAVLGSMILQRARLLATGRELVLEVVPVDPRSLFQGDYVILGYPISRVPAPPGVELTRGTPIYVTLQKGANDTWTLVQTSATRPTPATPDQVVLKGRVQYAVSATDTAPAQAMVDYGIEQFFVPEGTGHELEKIIRDRKLFAVIAVDGSGNAGVKGLMADGKRVYEEPLL
jgi:uncharacterized membrane-anchored protein